jgi:DNA mismatch endonuclease (patch repair protein)
MESIRATNTKPELIVRKELSSLGYKYRLHRPNLPGRPDIVFASRKKAIFVNGCFWHQHGCELTKMPSSNLDYWVPKFERNKRRDRSAVRELRSLGWKVLILWECQIAKRLTLKRRLERFLR